MELASSSCCGVALTAGDGGSTWLSWPFSRESCGQPALVPDWPFCWPPCLSCLCRYVDCPWVSSPGIVVALPVAFYAIASTTLISDFLGRGGTRGITTLSSRTIAWQAAVDLPQTAWQQLFGGGLSLKRIPVPARWWSEQGLDSSWISGLVQVGIVGVILLLVWTLVTGFRAARAPTPERLLWSGLLSYVVTRSALESGLFDATPAFLVFFLIALLPRAMQHSLARDSAPSRHGTLLSPSHRVPASSGSVF